MSIVTTKQISVPPADICEISRYAGGGGKDTERLIENALSELGKNIFSGNICMKRYTVACPGDGVVDFGFARVKSLSLEKLLSGCFEAIVFCATIGFDIDRLITKYSAVSPVKALVFQSIGTERIEALCDSFCAQLKDELEPCEDITARFSPGYGDLPLDFQKEIFKELNLQKNLGVFLSESLIMSPSKSVTAIVGIKQKVKINEHS